MQKFGVTEKMFELGSVAKVDVYRARVNLGTDSISYLTQENTVILSEHNLNITIGRNPGEAILISEQYELDDNLADLDSLIEFTNKNNPNLIKTNYDIKSATYDKKMAYGQLSPKIGFFMNYSRRVPEFTVLYDDFNSKKLEEFLSFMHES